MWVRQALSMVQNNGFSASQGYSGFLLRWRAMILDLGRLDFSRSSELISGVPEAASTKLASHLRG